MTSRIDRHPLTGETVLIVPNRLERPNALLDQERTSVCPFCPGHEHETPPEIERVESGTGWLIRVVPNKYPIAGPDLEIRGVHEVIIESPNHEDEVRMLDPRHARALIDVWMRRLEAATELKEVRSAVLFRNRGPHAGESIRHPHSQLIGLPYIPERIARQRRNADDCPLCTPDPQLEISTNQSFVLHAVPASRFAHQCWISPRSHAPSPELSTEQRGEFAEMIQMAERALHRELGDVSMNWSLIQAPVGEPNFHWYLELTPRLTGIAGLELATGSFVNLVAPERSAEMLRQRIS